MQRFYLKHTDEELREKIEEVKRRTQRWIEEGNSILEYREKLGLSRAFIARETGVSYGRLTRLEKGEKVREAKLIMLVYKLTLEKVETHRTLASLLESTLIRQ